MDDWKVIGTEPYTRRDGSATELWLWQRPCKHCGASFTVKTPAACLDSGSFLSKHCDACKDPKDVARGRARAEAWRQKNANARKAACTASAPRNAVHALCVANSVHHCTTTAPRCTEVQRQSGDLHHQVRDPLARGPAVVQRCGARCDANEIEDAKNSAQVFTRKGAA